MADMKAGMSFIKDNRDVMKSLLNYSSLGLEMGLSVAIGLIAGYLLDSYFKVYPYLTIIFMVFGIVAAFKALYKALKRIERDERDNHS